ncbi:hypothetical protein ABS71_05190 [bacterium SCN 62-11]|nr:M23 family metallopeptidase [Candidatus Eremiobacteraeota bacterium]ODT74866.1 MAG: hypothetical protein ABS71_05190 [bacterium SCN 62-11]
MSARSWLLALLLATVAGADPELVDPVVARGVNSDTGADIYVSNRLGCDMTVTLELVEQQNIVTAPPFPCTRTIPGHSEVLFGRIRAAGDGRWNYSYKSFWHYGSLEARHDDSVVYSLPYASGVTMKINQGYHGKLSHTGDNEYATDFSFASGTPVLAAREGVVVSTEERWSRGGATPYFRDRANLVRVRHSDGTIGEYDHFRLNGVEVEEGQTVKRGDLLGYSGATGFATGPHLHFIVYSTYDGHRRHSYPIRFRTAESPAPVELLQDVRYTAP